MCLPEDQPGKVKRGNFQSGMLWICISLVQPGKSCRKKIQSKFNWRREGERKTVVLLFSEISHLIVNLGLRLPLSSLISSTVFLVLPHSLPFSLPPSSLSHSCFGLSIAPSCIWLRCWIECSCEQVPSILLWIRWRPQTMLAVCCGRHTEEHETNRHRGEHRILQSTHTHTRSVIERE